METNSYDLFIWLGILFCITQSGMFSGLNLALLGISRLRLEVEASAGSRAARRIMDLRQDFNFLLTTILWGNVSVNVLLALLSDSVMTGVTAFFFSTFLITFFGEIAPQAYFSRHAMRMGSLLAPVLRCYQFLLYPVAKPSALVLDWWLGQEGIKYFRERDLITVIRKHIESKDSDVGKLEGLGAMNFLTLDDLPVQQEGSPIDPESIIQIETSHGKPVFPAIEQRADDPFLQAVNRSGRKWVVLVDEQEQPLEVINANAFLRDALFRKGGFDPEQYCHHPIIIRNEKTLIGKVLPRFRVSPTSEEDNVVHNDIVLVWGDERRVITGANILGRLLEGIVIRDLEHAFF